jgi:hypothetical protein
MAMALAVVPGVAIFEPGTEEADRMGDWIVMLCTLGCFSVALLYLRACAALKGDRNGS